MGFMVNGGISLRIGKEGFDNAGKWKGLIQKFKTEYLDLAYLHPETPGYAKPFHY
jgi:hypothetical protein